MRTHAKPFIAAAVLGATLLAASALYAHDAADGMSMGNGMMGSGSGSLMGMMGQMSQMAQNCNAMRGSHGRAPNSQWRQPNEKDASPKKTLQPGE